MSGSQFQAAAESLKDRLDALGVNYSVRQDDHLTRWWRIMEPGAPYKPMRTGKVRSWIEAREAEVGG